MIHIVPYNECLQDAWDSFVERSKNGTFLLKRTYMDYHKDKFPDLSLMFYSGQNLCGIIPITVDWTNSIASSHNGLTYGGLIVSEDAEYELVREMMDSTIRFFRHNNISTFYYKAIPYIYHKYPAQEDLYWLTSNGAKLYSRSVSSVIELAKAHTFSALRIRKIKKALQYGIELLECDIDKHSELWKQYWTILDLILSSRHGVAPVHTYKEICFLKYANSASIRLYVAQDKISKELLAGVVTYETVQVEHCQYIAASDNGCKYNALDLLLGWMINRSKSKFRYFDFGVSTENSGLFLNKGLLFQKQGFGGRAVCYDTYKCML